MIAAVVRRFLRKHAFALALNAIVLGLVFLPMLVGRVVSPNDVYLHYDPWASTIEGRAQNPLIHDPPMSYYTLAAMMKRGGFLHWNPFVGGGIPGVASVASAMLSPFALLPALLLPLPFFYSGMVVLKVLVSFWFAYLWLREERLGKRGAAVGATVIAAAGPTVVWWLWQGTNATSLYPALLWACARIAHGKSNRFALLVLLALAFLLSGFPATVAYGAWVAAAYLAWSLLVNFRFPWGEIRKGLLAAGVALLVSAPVLDPFVSFLMRTGYLEARAAASSSVFYPWSHLRSFVQPYWLGDPVTRSWIGDSALGPMNNFVEATVYVGVLTLPLALIGLFRRKTRSRLFFCGLALALVGLMFGSDSLTGMVAGLPGLKFSPMIRLRVVLPLAAGFLAGCGFVVLEGLLRRWTTPMARRVSLLVAVGLAADLGLFAAWFTPQIPWAVATPPRSATLEFLKSEPGPFRVAPTFPYMMPNSAQLVGLEDIRAHWGAERAWRELLRRLDPGSVDVSTVSTLNSLRMRLDDPLLGMLNVRYLIEPPKIDILRYLIQDRTDWVVPPEKPLALVSGGSLSLPIEPDEGCQAVAIPFSFRATAGRNPWVRVTVSDGSGNVEWDRTFDGDEASRLPVFHVPMPAREPGRGVVIAIASNGVWGAIESGTNNAPAWGCVRSPLVLSRSFPDGRVFENLAARPRFFATWDSVTLSPEEFLAATSVDLATVATFAGPIPIEVARLADVPGDLRRAHIEAGPLVDGARSLSVDAAAAFLLVSSEKVTPELEVTIDGEPTRVQTVNTMFAALVVPEGRHKIVFERRIGRGWWPWSLAGLVLWVVGGISDLRRKVARR